jgi:hypothetical protein
MGLSPQSFVSLVEMRQVPACSQSGPVIVSLVEILNGWKARSTSSARAIRSIEGGVESRDVADVRPQSCVRAPAGRSHSDGPIGLDNEVDRQAVAGSDLKDSQTSTMRKNGAKLLFGDFFPYSHSIVPGGFDVTS